VERSQRLNTRDRMIRQEIDIAGSLISGVVWVGTPTRWEETVGRIRQTEGHRIIEGKALLALVIIDRPPTSVQNKFNILGTQA
jgi:hypothetical protein